MESLMTQVWFRWPQLALGTSQGKAHGAQKKSLQQ
jgi:hypothetical protein